MGYRFYDSANIKPLLPFGHRLSYTDFKIDYIGISNNKDDFNFRVKVKNTGKVEDKEVVQIYWPLTQENKDKPYQSLVAFKKIIRQY